MKRIFSIISVLTLAVSGSALAEKPVTRSQLPQQARNFLASHYSKTGIAYATVDSEMFDATYDVSLEDGTRLEFTKKGDWTEIKSPRGGSVPASAVPSKIRAYIERNYPKATVSRMEIEGRDCNVELSNGVEITFNRQMEMVRSSDMNKHRPDHRFTLREN